MWYRQSTRREFIELIFGGQGSLNNTFFQSNVIPPFTGPSDGVLVVWNHDPATQAGFPILIVVSDESGLSNCLALINSSPQIPGPFSAHSRIVTIKEVDEYRKMSALQGDSRAVKAIIGLSYTEALLHSAGQIKLGDVGVAMCKRTLSICWAKALDAKVPFDYLGKLTDFWLDSYAVMSGQERIPALHDAVSAMYPTLSVAAELHYGLAPGSKVGRLCFAILHESRTVQEEAWADLANRLRHPVSLSQVADATREERASLFQSALRELATGDIGTSADEAVAIVAFLANQISPGSLEHLPILVERGDARMIIWYTFFAALLKPDAVLAYNGGVGYRLYRDIAGGESFEAAPICDIANSELQIFRRSGIEGLGKKIGHSGEIALELVPLVTGVFRFSSKATKQQVDLFEPEINRDRALPLVTREKLIAALHALDDMLRADLQPKEETEKLTKSRAKKRAL